MSDAADRIRSRASDLAASVARYVREHRLPGAAAGIVVGERLAWSFGYGFADVESGRTSSPSGLYRIASITKTFTATAIMQLRDEGKLDLDDPAVTHLPELAGATSPFAPIETVTLRRLLSHESGLMGDPPGTDWEARVYETDVVANLSRPQEIRAAVPPSTQTKYSNLAFQLLGEIVTRRSGTPYGDYVREHILDPLGMRSTAFDPPPEKLRHRCATGYAPRRFSDRLDRATPAGAPHSPVAEGGLWSSVEDLARWISAQFREDAGPRSGDRIIAGETLREMHRPRYLADEGWTRAFAIGWHARRRGEDVWIQHSGGLPGFITNVSFHVKERVGSIVLFNGVAEAADLSMELGAIALDQARAAVALATVPPPVPETFEPLLGLYTNEDRRLPASIEWRDGRLTFVSLEDPTWLATLTPTDDSMVFVVDPGIRESGERVEFDRTTEARIRSVSLGSDRLWRLESVEDDQAP